jgi:hypothetical protein
MEVIGQFHAPAREIVPGSHWLGGWVGPRAGLHTVSKRKFPSPRRESNPDHPIVQPVVSRYPGSHLAEGLTPSHGVH